MSNYFNTYYLLKKLMPGLLPLVLLISLDWFFGIEIAMAVSISIGAIGLVYAFKISSKLDSLIILNLLLILIFGTIVLFIRKTTFYDFRAIILEASLVTFLGLLAFVKKDITKYFSRSFIRGIVLTEGQVSHFNNDIKNLFYLLTAHLIIMIGVFLWSDENIWYFISRTFVFVILGGYFTTQILTHYFTSNKMKEEEWLPVVDEHGGVKGKVARSQVHGVDKEKILHPVVHLHILTEDSIYLQKRPINKLVQPGKWDTSVGGHLAFGETLMDGLEREAFEELGLKDFDPHFVLRYIWETEVEKELVYLYVSCEACQISPNRDEVEDGKFWPVKQIRENLEKEVFTPNFEKEFRLLNSIYFSKI